MNRRECWAGVAMVALILIAGRVDMQDDDQLTAADAAQARADMVLRAAEQACGGDVVTTRTGVRCADGERAGSLIARMETRP